MYVCMYVLLCILYLLHPDTGLVQGEEVADQLTEIDAPVIVKVKVTSATTAIAITIAIAAMSAASSHH